MQGSYLGADATSDVFEADRITALFAAADERGCEVEDVAAEYAPGELGCHEALHTASIVMDLVDKRLCDHPSILTNARWYELSREAHAKLFELYQAIGAWHLEPNDDGPASR